MKIRDILKQGELLSQFSEKERNWLDKRIKTRKDGKPGVECVVRGLNADSDYFELKPEEIVRQLYAHRLIEEYGYSKDQLEFEVQVVYAGREVIKDKRIDICFTLKDKKKNPDNELKVSLDEYLSLSSEEQKLYKEFPIIGKNENPIICKEEYDALPAEKKKYYLAAEVVKEWSERVRDTKGHIFVKHDLIHHDSALPNKTRINIYSQNGIAGAFAMFSL